MQLAVASNSFPQHSIAIGGFLVRLQPLHLDESCVVKGRSIMSKSTLFIQEAWQMTCACWGFEKNRQTHLHLQLSPNVKTNAKNFGPPLFHKVNYLLCVLWSQTLLAPTVLALSVWYRAFRETRKKMQNFWAPCGRLKNSLVLINTKRSKAFSGHRLNLPNDHRTTIGRP